MLMNDNNKDALFLIFFMMIGFDYKHIPFAKIEEKILFTLIKLVSLSKQLHNAKNKLS